MAKSSDVLPWVVLLGAGAVIFYMMSQQNAQGRGQGNQGTQGNSNQIGPYGNPGTGTQGVGTGQQGPALSNDQWNQVFQTGDVVGPGNQLVDNSGQGTVGGVNWGNATVNGR